MLSTAPALIAEAATTTVTVSARREIAEVERAGTRMSNAAQSNNPIASALRS